MRLSRVLALLRKDLALGPRSPVFLWVLVLPVAMTLLVQVVFGTLFVQQPRLGIVDLGDSQITVAVATMEGIDLTRLDDVGELKRRVEANDLDVGLVLPPGFDEAVRAGDKPLLEFYVGGESLASDRLVLAVTTVDLVRQIEGRAPPVEVELVQIGEADAVPIASRLVPLLVLMALMLAGIFLTSFSLVQEREDRTLHAILVTPMALPEVLVAKGVLGLLLALLMTVVTLALNGALGGQAGALLLALLAGGVMSVQIGLLFGTASQDTKSLYTLFKSLQLFVMAPVVFYLFPEWPQWIAQLFPTYWFLEPIFRVTIQGASLADVAIELLVAAAICAALVPVILVLARRVELQVASA